MRGNAPAILLLMIVPLKGPNGYNRSSESKIHFFYAVAERKIGKMSIRKVLWNRKQCSIGFYCVCNRK